MRKSIIFIACLFNFYSLFAQTKTPTDTASYKMKGLPAFTVYKAPDSTAFTNLDVNKKKPILLMLFSPECGHCQNVAKEILKNIDSFNKKTQILMFTWLPFSDMVSFYKDYNIANYHQITMAYDSKYFFVPFYKVSSYPKLIVYNKKGNFVKEFEGEIKIDEVWEAINE